MSFCRATVSLLALLAGLGPAFAVEVTVSAVPVTTFRDVALDGMVDKLIWRGGIALVSQEDTFGGLSGLAITGPTQAVFVTDRGNFASGQLA